MTKLFAIFTLSFGLFLASASVSDAQVRYGDDLYFVAETQLPSPSGGTTSLCHLVDYADFFFVPVYRSIKGYALSNDGCEGDTYADITAEQFAEGQSFGFFPADLPSTPRLSIKEIIIGHAGILLVALALGFKGLAWFIHDRKPRRRKGSDALAVQALAAMCHVAVSDGQVDESEITQIAGILTRLTGRGFDRDRVRALVHQIQIAGHDLNDLGDDLTEQERQIVMEAALNVAVADGQIHPNEYQLVSQIAHTLRINGAEFRAALARISAKMHANQAPV